MGRNGKRTSVARGTRHVRYSAPPESSKHVPLQALGMPSHIPTGNAQSCQARRAQSVCTTFRPVPSYRHMPEHWDDGKSRRARRPQPISRGGSAHRLLRGDEDWWYDDDVRAECGSDNECAFPRMRENGDCYRKMARIEDGWTDIETKC